jgi:hypothetical protein
MPNEFPISAHSAEVGELVRRRYEDGTTVRAIIADVRAKYGIKLSHDRLYDWIDGEPGDTGARLAPLARRRAVLGKRRRPLMTSRRSLVARIWRTAEQQVREVEHRLSLGQQEPADRERDARMLAIMVKTLRELTSIDVADADRPGKTKTQSEIENDDGPADIDEFRRELARRLEAIIARRHPGTGNEPAPGVG